MLAHQRRATSTAQARDNPNRTRYGQANPTRRAKFFMVENRRRRVDPRASMPFPARQAARDVGRADHVPSAAGLGNATSTPTAPPAGIRLGKFADWG